MGQVIVIGRHRENFFRRSLFFGIYIYLKRCCFARRDSSYIRQWLMYLQNLAAIVCLTNLSKLSRIIYFLFYCLITIPVNSSSSSKVSYYDSSYSLKLVSLIFTLRYVFFLNILSVKLSHECAFYFLSITLMASYISSSSNYIRSCV